MAEMSLHDTFAAWIPWLFFKRMGVTSVLRRIQLLTKKNVSSFRTNCQFIRFWVNSDTPLIRRTFSLAMISSSAKATFIVLWTKTALAKKKASLADFSMVYVSGQITSNKSMFAIFSYLPVGNFTFQPVGNPQKGRFQLLYLESPESFGRGSWLSYPTPNLQVKLEMPNEWENERFIIGRVDSIQKEFPSNIL